MNCHYRRTDNQLERKKLSKAFEDFQGHEELKDGLSHCLSQPGALLLQSSTNPLHRYIYIISYLKDERIWLCQSQQHRVTQITSTDSFRMTFRIILNSIPVSPTACMICWRNLLSLHCGNKHTKDDVASVRRSITQISVSAGSMMFLDCWCEVKHRYSPVEEFVVDVLGSLHVGAHTIDDLNQLLQLLLQRLQGTTSGISILKPQSISIRCDDR